MEQRLPRALTYYLEVEAVTEDHVRQVTKLLRNIYGQKLLSELFAKEIRQEGSTFVYSPETALALLLEARPEELTMDRYAGWAKLPNNSTRRLLFARRNCGHLQEVCVVPEVGLEPTRGFPHRILSPIRIAG